MKKIVRFFPILVLVTSMLNLSCREEEFVFEGTPPEERLAANTNLATLLRNVSLNDGSLDNIIDGSSCFSLLLPVTVSVNGTEFTINEMPDLDSLESFIDELEDNDENYEVLIDFPATLLFPDFSETVVTDQTELQVFIDDCDNEEDDDIECVDLQYPITASLFNLVTEETDVVSIRNDKKLFDFIDLLNTDDIVSLDFPIALTLSDDTILEVANNDALETVIESVKDVCEEGDGEDFEDESCEDCDANLLTETWAICTEWSAHKFEIDSEKLQGQYAQYLFNFSENGSVIAASNTDTFFGTWTAQESGEDITLEIDITGLDDFNTIWELKEIKETSRGTDVRLQIDNGELHFRENCENGEQGNNTGLDPTLALTGSELQISSYIGDDVDLTTTFNGYSLDFNVDGTVVANNGSPINGTWSFQNGNKLVLDFGASPPFDQLNLEWGLVSISETTIELCYNGPGGVKDVLVLSK